MAVADALAAWWLSVRLGVTSLDDIARRMETQGYRLGYDAGSDDGFEEGVTVGCALGRHLEALRWAAEVGRWRRLVRWTAGQRGAA